MAIEGLDLSDTTGIIVQTQSLSVAPAEVPVVTPVDVSAVAPVEATAVTPVVATVESAAEASASPFEKRKLGMLGSGQEVYDRPRTHVDDKVEVLLPRILPMINVTGDEKFVERVVEFSEPVGQSKVVEIEEGDIVFYAHRPNRDGLSKFVGGKEPKTTNEVSVVLLRGKPGKKVEDSKPHYVLVTAFIGAKAGLEPYDPNAKEEDREYWKKHAFVAEITDFVPESVTSIAPEHFQ